MQSKRILRFFATNYTNSVLGKDTLNTSAALTNAVKADFAVFCHELHEFCIGQGHFEHISRADKCSQSGFCGFLPRITRILTNFRVAFVVIREIRGREKVQHVVDHYKIYSKYIKSVLVPGLLLIKLTLILASWRLDGSRGRFSAA